MGKKIDSEPLIVPTTKYLWLKMRLVFKPNETKQEIFMLPPIESLYNQLQSIRGVIPPTVEYLYSSLLTCMYFLIALRPELLPDQVQPLVEILHKSELMSGLWVTITLAFLGVIDGAVKISFESLPVYKQYLKQFVFNKNE